MQEYVFKDEHEFKEKLKELRASGVAGSRIETYTPVPIHGLDAILQKTPTKVRWWAFVGAIFGAVNGFFMTNYTVWKYPLYVSEKPLYSQLPFIVIVFELTILLGSLATFVGFLALARMPNILRMIKPLDYGNQFAIVVRGD